MRNNNNRQANRRRGPRQNRPPQRITNVGQLVRKTAGNLRYLDPLESRTNVVKPIIIKVPGDWVRTSQNPIAAAIAADPVILINNWATKWQATFKEYQVVKVEALVRPDVIDAAATSLTVLWDETSSAVPTAVTSANQDHITLEGWNSPKGAVLAEWKPTDPLDCTYQSTATSFVGVYLKVYDQEAAASKAFSVEWLFTLSFRGFV